MAKRPVFCPTSEGHDLVKIFSVDFEWFPGFSIKQKQRSIDALHEAARLREVGPILEISTKSSLELGSALSAFNLRLTVSPERNTTVEGAYQGSKVFDNGGPYPDLFDLTGRQIRRDQRLKNSGNLVAFEINRIQWPLEPKTVFYDWLYVSALCQNKKRAAQLLKYQAFTDIEFNPRNSINCQAHGAALYVALSQRKLLAEAISDRNSFLAVMRRYDYKEEIKGLDGFSQEELL